MVLAAYIRLMSPRSPIYSDLGVPVCAFLACTLDHINALLAALRNVSANANIFTLACAILAESRTGQRGSNDHEETGLGVHFDEDAAWYCIVRCVWQNAECHGRASPRSSEFVSLVSTTLNELLAVISTTSFSPIVIQSYYGTTERPDPLPISRKIIMYS